MLLLSLVLAADPGGDALARHLVSALETSAPPGLRTLVVSPRAGWTLEFDLPFSGAARCQRPPGSHVFGCTRGDSGVPAVIPIDDFIAHLDLPADCSVEFSMNHPLVGELSLSHGTTEHRLVVRGVDGRLWPSAPLPFDGLGALEFEARLTQELFVLRSSESGNGNNASGFVRYRLVRLVEGEEGVLRVTASIDLGGGAWGRTVTEQGFFHSSKVDVRCPRIDANGVELTRSCGGDVDPRSFTSFEQLCARQRPCATPPSRVPDRWIQRGEGLRRLSALRLRAATPGVLRVTEVSSELDVELFNASSDALDVSGATIGEDDVTIEGPCVIDAGEYLTLSKDLERSACAVRLGPGFFIDDGVLEVVLRRAGTIDEKGSLRRGAVIARARANFAVMPDEVDVASWQVDARGRTCVATPSLGRANPWCIDARGR